MPEQIKCMHIGGGMKTLFLSIHFPNIKFRLSSEEKVYFMSANTFLFVSMTGSTDSLLHALLLRPSGLLGNLSMWCSQQPVPTRISTQIEISLSFSWRMEASNIWSLILSVIILVRYKYIFHCCCFLLLTGSFT